MIYILIAIVIGLVFGLAFGDNKPKEKEWKPKSNWSLKSYWKSLDDYDMNYGTLSMEKRKKRHH